MRTALKILLLSSVIGFANGAQAQSWVEPDPIFADSRPTIYATDNNVPANAAARRAPRATTAEWSGVYIGINSGWGSGTLSDPDIIDAIGDLQPTGGLGGIQLGYNYQTDMIVFGLETDIDFAQISKTQAGTLSGTILGLPAAGFYVLKTDMKSLGTLRLRFGVDYDSSLFYVTGGLAYGEQKISAGGLATIGPNFFADAGTSSETHVGWTVGVGGEFLITRTVSLKAEYLYVDLGEQTHFAGTYAETKVSNDDSILRVGLNYKP